MNTAVAYYTDITNVGTTAFPVWAAFKNYIDAEEFDLEHLAECIYQGPSSKDAIAACGDTFGYSCRKTI